MNLKEVVCEGANSEYLERPTELSVMQLEFFRRFLALKGGTYKMFI